MSILPSSLTARTVVDTPIDYAKPGVTYQSSVDETLVAPRHDWIVFARTIGAVFVLLLLLQNTHWIPGGDSELYLSAARSLHNGDGFLFNNQSLSLVPPGWPAVLAAAMYVSTSFLFLKSINAACILGSLAMGYWICRRFASPGVSSLVILLTALISHVFILTIWLHSDPSFMLVSTAALLLAFQLNELSHKGVVGWPMAWRMAAIAFLLAGSVFIRWTGLLSWGLVGAVLINGEWPIPKLNSRWLAFFFTLVVTGGTFYGVRGVLTMRPTSKEAAANLEIDTDVKVLPDVEPGTAPPMFTRARPGRPTYMDRVIGWGNWLSFLFWQPFRLSQSFKALSILSRITGAILLIPVVWLAVRGVMRKQWLILALLVYSFSLCISWSNANARYLVPVSFIFLIAIFKQTIDVAKWMKDARLPMAWAPRAALVAFAGSMLLCNGALYAVEVYVERSDNIYSTYEAGLHKDLIAAAKWMRENGVKNREVAVSHYYVNMGASKKSRFGLRTLTALTGLEIRSVPSELGMGPPDKAFIDWTDIDWINSKKVGVKIRYFLYQPEVSPWRVSHFRMGWLQKLQTNKDSVDTGAGWRLYKIEDGKSTRIALPAIGDFGTVVPDVR